MRSQAFVFLGTRIPEEALDVQRILQNFDRLYPLYKHVESESGNTARVVRSVLSSTAVQIS